jgi:hypothetical protein
LQLEGHTWPLQPISAEGRRAFVMRCYGNLPYDDNDQMDTVAETEVASSDGKSSKLGDVVKVRLMDGQTFCLTNRWVD